MNEKRDCAIVQDLLPNYIEKLTNEETNQYIKEHLESCNNCAQILEDMEKDLKLNTSKSCEKETNYIKKYNKKLKVLKLIICIIVILTIGTATLNVAKRMHILYNLSVKASQELEKREITINAVPQQDMLNEHIKLKVVKDNIYYEIEAYKKDGNYLATIYHNPYNKNEFSIIYKNENEHLLLENKEIEKTMTTNLVSAQMNPTKYADFGFGKSLQIVLLNDLKETSTLYGHECYVIYFEGTKQYIEKNTGIVILSEGLNSTEEFIYETGVVKDSDIVRPDTTGYKLIEE